MLGAIIGDVIGSYYESNSTKEKDFPLFQNLCRVTDDSVLTLAVAEAVLKDGKACTDTEYKIELHKLGNLYPNAGYGGNFNRWLKSDNPQPYNSWGNGSAMRVSAVSWSSNTEEEVLHQAELTALPTHNHLEGIKGAQAVALAIFLARTGHTKQQIKERVHQKTGYDLTRTIASIRPDYGFEVSCKDSVPEAIIAFLDSDCFEDAIRNAISLGGDADTQACIAGSIAEAFYGSVPDIFLSFVLPRMDDRLFEILKNFAEKYLPEKTATAVNLEYMQRLEGSVFPPHPLEKAYKVIFSSKTRDMISSYLHQLEKKISTPGKRLASLLANFPALRLNEEWLLLYLVQSKIPCIFAESGLYGDGTDWNSTELTILGNIGISVPVAVYDNGRHYNPDVFEHPVQANLLFIPGALLRNGTGNPPADSQVIKNEQIDYPAYKELYRQRLIPLLKYANAEGARQRKKVLITVPGLGCGQFAGPYRGTLGELLEKVLEEILQELSGQLSAVSGLWYDPYKESKASLQQIGDTTFIVQPLAQGGSAQPQLAKPADFKFENGDFGNCLLYSIVAWDHVSWPGNDYYDGSRSTDDGVKAAATDSMFKITGFRGIYDSSTNCYLPPLGEDTWSSLIYKYDVKLTSISNTIIVEV